MFIMPKFLLAAALLLPAACGPRAEPPPPAAPVAVPSNLPPSPSAPDTTVKVAGDTAKAP